MKKLDYWRGIVEALRTPPRKLYDVRTITDPKEAEEFNVPLGTTVRIAIPQRYKVMPLS